MTYWGILNFRRSISNAFPIDPILALSIGMKATKPEARYTQIRMEIRYVGFPLSQ